MIVIDPASPTPPFEQLRSQLARQIQDHSLAVGTRLPTIRRLAADLGLAVNTVGWAYRELEEAGLIASASEIRSCRSNSPASTPATLSSSRRAFAGAASDEDAITDAVHRV
jgi:DNA-binding transcriptional regulator YhcF (GntR family)